MPIGPRARHRLEAFHKVAGAEPRRRMGPAAGAFGAQAGPAAMPLRFADASPEVFPGFMAQTHPIPKAVFTLSVGRGEGGRHPLRLARMALGRPMKGILRTAIATTVLFVQPSQAAAPAVGHGRLCFNREEQNGYANIVPVEIKIGHGDGAAVIGGEAACLDIWANLYPMQLEWRWDERDPAPRAYQSSPLTVDLKEGRTETFEICPVASPAEKPDVPWWKLTSAGHCPWPR